MTGYDVNLSILFTELPLLERPAAAKEAGFDAVEFWWPFAVAVPADAEVEAFVRAVGDAGVRLVGLNFFAGDMPGGDRGLVSWPARSGEFRDNVDVTLALHDTCALGWSRRTPRQIQGVQLDRLRQLSSQD
jgi:hydroxypyruvate isomerase